MNHSDQHTWLDNFPDDRRKSLWIKGPCGKIESLTTWPAQDNPHQAVAVICHPHPQQLGTMHNKIVTTLAKAYDAAGIATVRFNFRGVGNSDGEFGHGKGEVEDALAVISWVEQVLTGPQLYLAGFSFGSYIAAYCATEHDCQGLISIAPPVSHMPFANLPCMQCPWQIIQGDQDEVVSALDVERWFQSRPKQENSQLDVFPGAGHFFHGQLIQLRKMLRIR